MKKPDHRNVFLNLAVPIMQASEPGDLQKIKLTEKLETTLWDRWDVKGKDKTLRDVIKHIEQTYSGLEVRDVLRGNTPIYFHSIMVTKEKERETTMQTKLIDLIDVHIDDLEHGKDGIPYVDLTITCIAKGDESAKILEGVPPVRVLLG